MAANVRTDMRIPTRAAPRPPGTTVAQRNVAWSSNNDLFGATSVPQKKKPPPRPPPPKFIPGHSQSQRGQKPKKPARPTELLTNIFGRKTSNNKYEHSSISYSSNRPVHSNGVQSSTESNVTVSLIDLSPPGSPTFTTRSSSDGVSVDSFGSDGNSNPSAFTSSGNTSQTESAFEDDFDFFGGFAKRKVAQNDPWKITTSDPFQPLQENGCNNTNTVKQLGNASFFAFNSGNSSENQVPSNRSASNAAQSMPTIIRARPAKPPVPKNFQSSLAPSVAQFNVKPVPMARSIVPSSKPITCDVSSKWTADFEEPLRDPSPPMPSIPPPAPPIEYLIEEGLMESSESPYGIALYEFATSQPGDLPLKVGDVVTLTKVINDDWLEGQIGNRQGVFPANFIDVKVPLPNLPTNVVNALYTFQGETWEDLAFEEGSKITVLSRISDDWLYGECNGKSGQFPANYVDRVPTSLPDHT